MNLPVPESVGNLLNRWETVSVSRRSLVYGVRNKEREKVVLIQMNNNVPT
jgi:hypothetical protein